MNRSDLYVLGEDAANSAAELLALCYNEQNPSAAFRASWILEYVATNHHDRFLPVLAAFAERFPYQKNRSCQRHFTKILMEITRIKAPECYTKAFSKINTEPLVEAVFGWLIDTRTPVAVQANCLEILAYLSRELDWIKEELIPQIQFIMKTGSAAIQSRGRKILNQIQTVKTAN